MLPLLRSYLQSLITTTLSGSDHTLIQTRLVQFYSKKTTRPCAHIRVYTILTTFTLLREMSMYAFVADIEKVFMRIKMNEEDRNYVRFLWFEDGDPDKPIKVYRYISVFFGGTSSQFILNSTVLQHLLSMRKIKIKLFILSLNILKGSFTELG